MFGKKRHTDWLICSLAEYRTFIFTATAAVDPVTSVDRRRLDGVAAVEASSVALTMRVAQKKRYVVRSLLVIFGPLCVSSIGVDTFW
jgi:hypothetical protein